MKTLKLVIFFFAITLPLGCKNNESINQDRHIGLIEDESGKELPNKSDTSFSEALITYGKNEYKTSGEHLEKGIKELSKEAKLKGSIFNEKLTTSIDHLTDISKELENGQNVDETALRNMIANAEINVNHGYLASDNIYMLTEPEKINEARLHDALNQNLQNLEDSNKKLEGEAKKEGQKLEAEGQKIKDDFEAWTKRAEEHEKRSENHFKEYQPG